MLKLCSLVLTQHCNNPYTFRYTGDENFEKADAVFDFIGDPPEERFDLAFCGSLVEKQYVS